MSASKNRTSRTPGKRGKNRREPGTGKPRAAATGKGGRIAAAVPPRSAAKPKPKPARTRVDTPPNVERVPAGAGAAISEGSKVPSFELSDQDGKLVKSRELEGKPYVLYFYPKDDTPGCTIEACGFRDTLPGFSARGVRVLGVSPDAVGSHARFRDKHGLNFTLLSDPDRTLAEAFGVWVKKQNYGREYMGVERTTFLVNSRGVVHKVWRKVKVPGHVSQVLEDARYVR